MKSKRNIMLTILIVIALANTASLSHKTVDCRYSNYNGSFTFEEMNFKERNFDMCLRKFAEFRKINKEDTVLYRLCKQDIFRFWNWGNYLFRRKFKLPYMSWDEIEKRRGAVSAKSGFQDF